MIDYSELIGIPFEYGGRSVNKLDCYGLVMHLHEVRGISLPDYISPSDAARIAALITGAMRFWEEAEEAEGMVALFSTGSFMHVGYCIGGGRFIHTWEQSGGVCIERLDDWKHRTIGFYKYVG